MRGLGPGQTTLVLMRRFGDSGATAILRPPPSSQSVRGVCLDAQGAPSTRVDWPYHDYSTSALRELTMDLESSQVQLADQRADYGKRAGPDDDDLCQLDVLIKNLGHQLAAVDHELVTRDRERAAANASGHRGIRRRPGRLRTYSPRVNRANPKPHCRAKRVPAGVRRPQ